MPVPRGTKFRVKRTGKTTGVRLAIKSGKVIEAKKLRGLKPRGK